MTTTTKVEKEKEYVTRAPPPFHSILTLAAMFAVFVPCVPSMKNIDEFATLDTFSKREFPDIISLQTLIYVRIAFSLVVLATTLYSIIPANGWDQATNYLPSSKLRQAQIRMRGFRILLPYTSWCWNLLGISFALNAYIAQQALLGNQVPKPLLRCALLIYETASPSALLVSFVVSYAIWPNILKQGGSTAGISEPRTLVWHNANVIMALIEAALLGGIPVKLEHIAVSPIYGLCYIIMTWSLMHFWKPDSGPQFIYFFFDTTLGKTTSYALLALLVVMMSFYVLFAVGEMILNAAGGGFIVHSLAVIVISAGVCRFKD